MFVEGPPRRGEAGAHLALDDGREGRLQPDRRADLVVRVGAPGIGGQLAFSERERSLKVVVEDRHQVARCGRHAHERARPAQVVVDGERAPPEQQIQQDDGGYAPVGGRVVGVGRNRLPECGEGLLVVEVVGEDVRPGCQSNRYRIPPRGRGRSQAEQERGCAAASTKACRRQGRDPPVGFDVVDPFGAGPLPAT